MSENVSVLVVAAHPDDEVLGCGGTVARHAARGDDVHVLILGEGASARDDRRNAEARSAEIAALEASARAAAEVLGSRPPRFAGLPDNRMDSVALLDIAKRIESVIAEIEPGIVYTHHGGDLNIDHSIVHRAVLTACRPVPGASVVAIYAFETVSGTEWAGPAAAGFMPSRFVDISENLDAKMRALDAYGSEMRPFPHARSRENVAALARLRGASVGVEAAEAFMVIREIVR